MFKFVWGLRWRSAAVRLARPFVSDDAIDRVVGTRYCTLAAYPEDLLVSGKLFNGKSNKRRVIGARTDFSPDNIQSTRWERLPSNGRGSGLRRCALCR